MMMKSDRNDVVPLEEHNQNAGALLSSSKPPSSSPTAAVAFWTVLRFFNTFAVAILAVVVTLIFLQLQYVNIRLNQQADRIENLSQQMQTGQEEIHQQVEKEHSLTLYQMAGFFVLLAGLLTMFHMTSHLRNYHEPVVQRKIITILWMSPIYGVTSFLSLVFPSADGYLAVIRDFYEAYVVYTFLSFLISVLGRGNRDAVVTALAQHADHLRSPSSSCCCCCCYRLQKGQTTNKAKANAVLTECQILAMQFVFVRPVTSIANFVVTTLVEANNNADNEDQQWSYFKSPNFYISMVTNVSVFFAFTGLLNFYHAVREDLLWCQPFSKFMAIKGIVFVTFWQGLLISILANLHEGGGRWSEEDSSSTSSNTKSPREQAAMIQNILICLEMLFFSIAHWCVFPAEEWEPGYRPKQCAKPGIGIKDFVSDMSDMIQSHRQGSSAVTTEEDLEEAGGGGNPFADSARGNGSTQSYQSL